MYVDHIMTHVHLHTYFIVTNVFQNQKKLEKHLTTDHRIRTVNIRLVLRTGEKTGRPGPTVGKHVYIRHHWLFLCSFCFLTKVVV